MVTRAGIVVTGTEVLTGRVPDRNGPWLAEQLRLLGVDVGHVVVVGDRPADLQDALTFLAGTGVALVITTGGLGPTADDLTAEVVGGFQGRPSALDPALEQRIAAVVERLTARRGWSADPAAMAAGVRKQALVPAGAVVLEPVGTAPGLVVPPADGREGPTVVVLPGPPPELRGMWPAALAAEPVVRALAGRTELRQETVRLWRTLEAQLAVTLREVEPDLDGLEITTCMREGELEIVTRFAPGRPGRLRPAARGAHRPARRGAVLHGAHLGRPRRGRPGRRAHDRHRRVLHRRAAGRPADGSPGLLGLRPRGDHRLRELGQGAARRRPGRDARRARRGQSRGRGGPRRGCPGAVRGRPSAWASPASPGPDGGTPEKPVGTVHLCVAGPDGGMPGRSGCRARGRRCGNDPSRWRCTCCGQRLLGGPPA